MLEQGAQPLPFFFVGRNVTDQRIKRFMNTKHPLLSTALGRPDTRATWYTRDHIAGLLNEMDNANADGLRIYFGTYGPEENYSGQLCLLMVMTRADVETGAHSDISLENSADFEARSLSKIKDFNVGSPCPPICDPGMEYPIEDVS